MANKSIYVSYAEQDTKYAKWLGRILETNGFSTSIANYAHYDIEEATAAIDACDLVLILCSPKMKDIDYQSKETDYAFNHNKTLLAVVTEKCNIDGQYHYYLSQSKRFEIYNNSAKKIQLLIAEINKAMQHEDNHFQTSKIASYHVDLLSEKDIDDVLSNDKKKKSFWRSLSPFSKLYAKNPTVKIALRCYTVLLSAICGALFMPCLFHVLGIISIFFDEDYTFDIKMPLVGILIALIWLLLWHASYYASVMIAKLKVKNKFLILLLAIFSILGLIRIIDLL